MVTIDPNQASITVIVVFDVEPHDQAALCAEISGYLDTVKAKFPALVSSTLHASDDGSRVVNYAQWRTRVDYERFVEESLKREPPPIFKNYPPDTRTYRILRQVEHHSEAAP